MIKKLNSTGSVINVMYFGRNYSSNFISKVWTGHLASHFQEKFNSKSGKNAFYEFFFELSRENQEKLINWINANYTAFSDLGLKKPAVRGLKTVCRRVIATVGLKVDGTLKKGYKYVGRKVVKVKPAVRKKPVARKAPAKKAVKK